MRNPIEQFWKKSEKAISKSLERTTHKIRENIRELILARKTPYGGQQTNNADLFASGVLADPSKYRVVKKGNDTYILYPPANRKQVIETLRKEGYILFEVPTDASKWLEEILNEELKR